ncbi:ABC transporter ATP-binding protein [Nocardioides jishulii]|uniref:ABC-type quaternary amine transporter n=2 Tax=Nocardioides jishulii TaxID=2575440 RepID=A0A4U2YVY2_9ACTN|nr:ABC transporter ATP-binding protein [Nocardioides jishulii]TKI64912.1 ABC transporter ATP-binding protein [Nocardioides jishulii]
MTGSVTGSDERGGELLRLEQVDVAYAGVPAVRDVSLAVARGEVLAVLGPSGCGKSTLLRALAGLEPLTGGRIVFDGADLAGVPTHKRGFALMFQDGQLFGHLSVARNVGYPLRLRRRPRVEVAARVDELLGIVGLAGYGDRSPATLSGGERQRVALARALAVAPRLLLLDEPLSALDATLRESLAADLREILRAAGTTAVMVTHDHDEAFAVADTMAVMFDGQVVQHGPIADLWAHPATPPTATFLGYAGVRTGEAAEVLCRAAGVGPTRWIALRRSALHVDDVGPLGGRVLAVTSTPEQLRLQVELDEVGVVDAVAPLGRPLAVGASVRLSVDATRMATAPEPTG